MTRTLLIIYIYTEAESTAEGREHGIGEECGEGFELNKNIRSQ
jgi:hypothetical protein